MLFQSLKTRFTLHLRVLVDNLRDLQYGLWLTDKNILLSIKYLLVQGVESLTSGHLFCLSGTKRLWQESLVDNFQGVAYHIVRPVKSSETCED